MRIDMARTEARQNSAQRHRASAQAARRVLPGRLFLSAFLVLGLMLGLLLAKSAPLLAQDKPAAAPAFENQDALMAEMSRLANALEKQRKYNSILEGKIDILTHRLNAIEQSLAESKTKSGKPDIEKQDAEKQDAGKQDSGKESAGKDKREARRLPDDVEQFLDMGEEMMRRFFGIVKEYRREFESNRI